jgi:hypothetical protein
LGVEEAMMNLAAPNPKTPGTLNPASSRHQSPYLFGAVCPERGTGAALVLPACNSEACSFFNEIATKVACSAHAILILDQAGWHGAKELKARPCGAALSRFGLRADS